MCQSFHSSININLFVTCKSNINMTLINTYIDGCLLICITTKRLVSILIFDQNSINGPYFQYPRGILDSIISATEGLKSLSTLFIGRFHKYASLLLDPKMILSFFILVFNFHTFQWFVPISIIFFTIYVMYVNTK